MIFSEAAEILLYSVVSNSLIFFVPYIAFV